MTGLRHFAQTFSGGIRADEKGENNKGDCSNKRHALSCLEEGEDKNDISHHNVEYFSAYRRVPLQNLLRENKQNSHIDIDKRYTKNIICCHLSPLQECTLEEGEETEHYCDKSCLSKERSRGASFYYKSCGRGKKQGIGHPDKSKIDHISIVGGIFQ